MNIRIQIHIIGPCLKQILTSQTSLFLQKQDEYLSFLKDKKPYTGLRIWLISLKNYVYLNETQFGDAIVIK